MPPGSAQPWQVNFYKTSRENLRENVECNPRDPCIHIPPQGTRHCLGITRLVHGNRSSPSYSLSLRDEEAWNSVPSVRPQHPYTTCMTFFNFDSPRIREIVSISQFSSPAQFLPNILALGGPEEGDVRLGVDGSRGFMYRAKTTKGS